MTEEAKPVSRPWRRFLRFSVRGLIVVVLLVGGWLGWLTRNARIQRQIVAEIERAGGEVRYEAVRTDHDTRSWNSQLHVRRWLATAIGIDHFAEPIAVSFHKGSSDNELALLGRLPTLLSVSFEEANITDAGLIHLSRLSNLAELKLEESRRITDAGMVNLGRMTSLTELSLFEMEVTDGGLKHLSGLSNLSKLELGLTQITNSGLSYLEGLTNLSEVHLTGTRITDAGLVHLSALRKLSRLSLFGTEITDTGLSHLKGLTNLRKLDLRGTKVTDSGVEGLRRALPSLTIKHRLGHGSTEP